jgi:glycosyltransferase involved in cell wall biosynthesis
MKLKLSIITVNYNDAKGLRRTMNSVINQSFKDFEYILIDGGSSDESVEIIKEFENLKIKKTKDNTDQPDNSKNESLVNDHVSFQWLSERDKGIYHAMNKGITRARGEYCFFLNSGDYFVSNTVLESVFSENPAEDIVFGNLVVCLNENIVGKIIGKNVLTFLDLYNSDVVKHQSSFIKRSLFEAFGLYNEDLRIVADWEFFLKTLGLANVSYKYVNVDIAFFDNNGLSNNLGDITKTERKQILERYISPMMLADYKRFERYNILESAFQYKLTSFGLHVLAKFAKEYKKRTKRK